MINFAEIDKSAAVEVFVTDNIAGWLVDGKGEAEPEVVDALLGLEESYPEGFTFVVDAWVEGASTFECDVSGACGATVWGRIVPTGLKAL